MLGCPLCAKSGHSCCSNFLLDHLVGKRQQPIRHIQAERLRGLEIDDQLQFRGLLYRQVAGLFTLENATRVKSDLSVFLDQACSVTDEP